MMPKRPTKTALREAASVLASLSARKAGLASAAALTREERKAKARKAIAARWGKVKRPKGEELPVDQRQVMARLEGVNEVTLRIAPGSNGTRRRAAIGRLVGKGLVVVVKDKPDLVTITHGHKATGDF